MLILQIGFFDYYSDILNLVDGVSFFFFHFLIFSFSHFPSLFYQIYLLGCFKKLVVLV